MHTVDCLMLVFVVYIVEIASTRSVMCPSEGAARRNSHAQTRGAFVMSYTALAVGM